MTTNYLPFIKRQYFEVAANSRDYARLPLFSSGGGERVILGDFAVDTSPGLEYPMLMRIGILGYKYFTEDFQKVIVYHNGPRHLCSCWRFPKPYRLYPGQRMRAQVEKITDGPVGKRDHYGAIMFNGKRERDDKPIMLYDSDETPGSGGTRATLNGETLACPHDSPVLLYSATIPQFSGGPYVQIWGPDDREWFEATAYGGAAPPGAFDNDILAPSVNPMVLGEQNGWVLDPKQIFTAEFINQSAASSGLLLTLRGVIEVKE